MTGRRLLGGALLVAVLLAGGCGGKPAGGGASATPSRVQPIADCVTEDEQRAGGVRLDVGDKHTDALIVGTGTTGIVFANQAGATVCSWKPWADTLAQKGYRGLVFEYSGDYADKDVLAAVDALRKKGAQKVFLIGASRGGTAVLGAAPQAQPPVAGVVSLSGPQVYQGVDAFGAVQKLTVPVLFVAAKDDEQFGRDAQALYDACASKDKKLDLELGGDHGMSLLDDKISKTVEDFLKSH
jgi:alpha-beta hydrolase superfamily lysophospholipase